MSVIRTALGAALGVLLGVLVAAGLLLATRQVLRWATAPKIFAMEHGVIYIGVLLGAGFGAVSGALAGLASTLVRAVRERPPASAGPGH
jgi:hypothetical protein